MNFDHELEVDTERDVIGSMKSETSRRGGLSSSERLFFDMWIAHSHGNGFDFNRGHFYSIANKEYIGAPIGSQDI